MPQYYLKMAQPLTMYIGTEADDIQGIKVANITLFLVAQKFLLEREMARRHQKSVLPKQPSINCYRRSPYSRTMVTLLIP